MTVRLIGIIISIIGYGKYFKTSKFGWALLGAAGLGMIFAW